MPALFGASLTAETLSPMLEALATAQSAEDKAHAASFAKHLRLTRRFDFVSAFLDDREQAGERQERRVHSERCALTIARQLWRNSLRWVARCMLQCVPEVATPDCDRRPRQSSSHLPEATSRRIDTLFWLADGGC